MPIVIHHGPAGTRGARPIWACEELGIPYEIIDVGDLAASAEYRKSPEYRKLNPVGKVPAMTDGDLTMFESVAMMQYILDRYGGGQLQPAPGTASVPLPPPSAASLAGPLPPLPAQPCVGQRARALPAVVPLRRGDLLPPTGRDDQPPP